MVKPKSSPTLDALKEAAKGLSFTSETDAPLTPFAWPAGDPAAAVHKQAGAKVAVETLTLDAFLRAVPSEDKVPFDALALHAIHDELEACVGDGGVQKAHFVDGHSLGLEIYARGARRWLMLLRSIKGDCMCSCA